ncbi:MAG: hypothetical protein ACRDGV_06260 [Candidatus Limnocylindria bacterium]
MAHGTAFGGEPGRLLAGMVHSPLVMGTRLVLLALVLAQLADAATFTLGVGLHGIGIESNGIAGGLYRWAGLDGVLLAKGAVILITLALLVATATRFPRLLMWGSAAATSFGLLGFTANTLSLLILAG